MKIALSLIALGLMLTACGDPSSFKETSMGEPIIVKHDPDVSPTTEVAPTGDSEPVAEIPTAPEATETHRAASDPAMDPGIPETPVAPTDEPPTVGEPVPAPGPGESPQGGMETPGDIGDGSGTNLDSEETGATDHHQSETGTTQPGQEPTPPTAGNSQSETGNTQPAPAPSHGETCSEPASSFDPAAPVSSDDDEAPKLFADCDEHPDQGIVGELYQLPRNTSQLPNFATLSPLRTVCLSQLNIKDRQFTEGFPGVDELVEWFAVDMNFQVNMPKRGTYEFTLASDDGAILWIDGRKVIDNDGLHPVTEKKAKVYLSAGPHVFHVSYYQGPRWRIALELFWKVPGASRKEHIPSSAISRLVE